MEIVIDMNKVTKTNKGEVIVGEEKDSSFCINGEFLTKLLLMDGERKVQK